MMNYLIIANIYLILFYGFYRLFLSSETFFQLNRIYLVGVTAISFVLPAVQLEWLKEAFGSSTVFAARSSLDAVTLEVAPEITDDVNTMMHVPLWFYAYASGFVVQLFLLIGRSVHLRNRLRKSVEKDAYSFMRIIKVDTSQEACAKVFQHEQVHVRQLHSFDVLFVELVKLFNWFNPAVYYLRNSLKLIHEYIADEAVNRSHKEKIAYAELLIGRTFSVSASVLTNNFFHQSFIKNRIMMLFKDKSKRPALLKYALAAPLFIAMLLFSSAKVSDKAERITALALGQNASSEFYRLVGTKVYYLQEAKARGAQGVVDIAFDKEVNALKTKVLRTIGYDQEAEIDRVLRLPEVLKEMPEGKHVLRVKFLLDTPTKERSGESLLTPAGYEALEEVIIMGYKSASRENAKRTEGDAYLPVVQEKSTKTDKEIPPPRIVRLNADTSKRVTDFNDVQVQPAFPGGLHAFYSWIGSNYQYPAEAKKNGVSGTLHVGFIVEKDGSLTEIEVLKDLGHGTGEAAIALLKSSPKWKPGLLDGKPVRVSYSLPIKLNLANQDKKTDTEEE